MFPFTKPVFFGVPGLPLTHRHPKRNAPPGLCTWLRDESLAVFPVTGLVTNCGFLGGFLFLVFLVFFGADFEDF